MCEAEQIVNELIGEAVVWPDPRPLKAYRQGKPLDRFDVDPEEPGEGPSIGAEGDIQFTPHRPYKYRLMGREDPTYSLAHELVHRGQLSKAGANAEKATDSYIRRAERFLGGERSAKATADYLGHPYELMAHAYTLAAELTAELGQAKALSQLKSGELAAGPLSSSVAHFAKELKAENPKAYQRLLRYTYDYVAKGHMPKTGPLTRAPKVRRP